MKSTAFCPISDRRIDEHVARLNGAFTVVLLSVFLVSGSIIPIVFLLIDFGLRSGRWYRYSVLSSVSKIIAQTVGLKPALINAGPKIFAARIGLVFNIAIIFSFLAGWNTPALILAGIFTTFAFLESAFGICVACLIYPVVYKINLSFKN
ncbi:CDP-alcohol phosphatidyltransferase [Paludibacter propionicigenes WB4]|uniref:CDP-alcohol phosphatidyltransferase n=1 Tax=Paludibacter propionicigenes (strain DSM 17365 / JCM 13257 / WB4) TaxID=694427 RepID=E4T181_PALPW|nr:DUF4395 domain-containing protein [Paludibacter propionicigenes]ADQ78462.1 CDP-alcohol phosphatidyltransferase [Paludibacter propionicigenes WB4]